MRREQCWQYRGATTSTTMALAAGGLLLVAIGFSLGLLAGRGMADSGGKPDGSATLASTGAVAPPTTRPAPPTLGQAAPVEVVPPLLDFGEIPPGAAVTGSVEIRNLGTTPLRILTSRASCKCTAIDLQNKVIPPGGSVPLVASLEPGYNIGLKKAAVKVRFDGYDEILTIDITALITMVVQAQPSYISALDGTLSGVTTVKSTDGAPFRVLALNGKAPHYVNFDPERDEPRSSYDIHWDLSSYDPTTCLDAEGNPMRGYWPVETDHPGCGVFDIPVRHHCVKPKIPQPPQTWILSQRRIVIGTLREGDSAEFKVSMIRLPNRPPANETFTRVESESPEFTAELVGVRPSGDTLSATIRVTPTPGHRGLIYGDLRVFGNQYSEALPIVGRVVD